MTCLVFGSSHANRIYKNLKASAKAKTTFSKFLNCTKSGATYYDLQLPILECEKLTSKDLIVAQLFGNDIMEKNIFVEKKLGKRIIHCTKFVPKNETYIESLYENFKNKVKDLKCQIILFTNPFRYLHCCKKHFSSHKGLRQFQKRQNKKLKLYFRSSNVDVKDMAIGKKTQNIHRYLEDCVHFYNKFYKKVVLQLVKIYSRAQAVGDL